MLATNNISNLISFDQGADRIPFASTASNLIVIVAKCALKLYQPQTPALQSLVCHVRNKPIGRSIILLAPFLGNVIIYKSDQAEIRKKFLSQKTDLLELVAKIKDALALNNDSPWSAEVKLNSKLLALMEESWVEMAAEAGDPDARSFSAHKKIFDTDPEGTALLWEELQKGQAASINVLNLEIATIYAYAMSSCEKNAIRCVLFYFSTLHPGFFERRAFQEELLKETNLLRISTFLKYLSEQCEKRSVDPEMYELANEAQALSEKWWGIKNPICDEALDFFIYLAKSSLAGGLAAFVFIFAILSTAKALDYASIES